MVETYSLDRMTADALWTRWCHCRVRQLTRASPSMVYGRRSGVWGAQNDEEMKGILTKGFTTKGRPHWELTIVVLPLHGSLQLGGFSGGRFTPRSAPVASPCSHGALQGLDRAWKAVISSSGNGARARLLWWGKVVVGAPGGFFHRPRSSDGRGTTPWIQIPTESRISLRVHCKFDWFSKSDPASTLPMTLEIRC
jgi:hypothetical protein